MGQIIDQGFEVLRFRFGRIMAISLVVVLPLVAVPTLLSYGSFAGEAERLLDSGGSDVFFGVLFGTGGASGWWSALASLASPIAQALVGIGVATLVGGWVMGRDPTFGEACGRIFRRTPAALVVFAAGVVPKVVGIYLCLLPGLVMVALFLVASPVLATEDSGPFRTIARSWGLGRRRLWPLVGLTVAGVLLASLITLLLNLAGLAIVEISGASTWAWVLLGGLSVLGGVFLTALLAAWAALAYVDVRVRTEGMDLEIESAEVFAS